MERGRGGRDGRRNERRDQPRGGRARDARKRSGSSSSSKPRRPDKRADKREGGFGPHGKPVPRERERRADQEPRPRPPSARYRVKGERRASAAGPKRRGRSASKTTPTKRRRRAPADVESEILRLGGRRGRHLLDELMVAADAFGHDRDREAVRLLRPLRDALPDAPSVRELMGLAQYRIGNYGAAAKELEAFVNLTDSVEQHPVLMDAMRAQRRWRRVDDLWGELALASPSAELVTEGRIVAAGALADQGDLDAAIAMLTRKAGDVKRAKPHHLRLWYALADLEERAGNLARARALFTRVHDHDPEFADVATRVRTLA